MKLFKILSVLWLFNLAAIQVASAQADNILSYFSASENNGSVYLSWQIKSGSTCNGIQIYRSTNNLNFVQIGDIPGICGNISFAQDYSFTDPNPVKNSKNYYRLELGNNGFSQTVAVEVIDISVTGFQVRPNPAATQVKILFDNDISLSHNLNLYNVIGSLVFSASGKEDFFELDTSFLSNGSYFFTISASGKSTFLQGKLMVIH